jgi:hypothetical protein
MHHAFERDDAGHEELVLHCACLISGVISPNMASN